MFQKNNSYHLIIGQSLAIELDLFLMMIKSKTRFLRSFYMFANIFLAKKNVMSDLTLLTVISKIMFSPFAKVNDSGYVFYIFASFCAPCIWSKF